MNSKITSQTRDASYQAILPFVGRIQDMVYDAICMSGVAGLTAEAVHERVGCSLNSARSRLTELANDGRISVVRKSLNNAKTRKIAVFALPPINKI